MMKPKIKLADGQLRLGEISGFHGVQGWVKIFSDAQPRENIFSYDPWLVYNGDKVQPVSVLHWRKQGKTLVAKLKGINDKDSAREYLGAVIAVEQNQLPELDEGDFYWHQLVGMTVVTEYGDQPTELGQVKELIETGSNDVLIVKAGEKEYLVPWIPGEFILETNLDTNTIRVNWDPEF